MAGNELVVDTQHNVISPGPADFYFNPSEFSKKCKISTNCELHNAIIYIKEKLPKAEYEWFSSHPQFGHLFHMKFETNHTLIGLWTLLLRTVKTKEKRNEAWFVLNGVFNRYSMRKHALISGFNFKEYPRDYGILGSTEFVERFSETPDCIDKSLIKAVLDDKDRFADALDKLKMAVLNFLGTVIKQSKRRKNEWLGSFLLHVVDNLDACRTFPWERFTFIDNIEVIND